MIGSLKKNLILLIALIYLVFACDYVLFCRRDTSVVNMFGCFYSPKSQIKTTPSQEVKISSVNKRQLLHTFLSRPRVINNTPFSIKFSLVIITLLFLFTYSNLKDKSLVFLRNKYFSFLYTDIEFYQCWRI